MGRAYKHIWMGVFRREYGKMMFLKSDIRGDKENEVRSDRNTDLLIHKLILY